MMMLAFLLLGLGEALQLSQTTSWTARSVVGARSVVMTSQTPKAYGEKSRRRALEETVSSLVTIATTTSFPQGVNAAATKKVLVAGATGQTGRRVLERLSELDGVEVVGGVRNVDKAAKALAESSIAVRGAMIQQVAGLSTKEVALSPLDVVRDDAATLAETMKGYDALVIAIGFVPGNPLKMDAAAHAVDNVGTKKLADAADAAGVKKVVLVSSILTNGRNWGQADSPGFVVTNAFGHVLDEKIEAENYLRSKKNLDYTIVRPGGLKAKPPAAGLKVSKEDTLNAGEVSRDYVADVCVAALFDAKASNKVVEIIEDDALPLKPLAPSPNLPPAVPFI
mmetsp:Transcript_26721/g.82030  ORF Transcript_26721/g.82030 Transcript_26721/m.82030 type:complete len:338 (+) Transcript_26721:574-1587(+)